MTLGLNRIALTATIAVMAMAAAPAAAQTVCEGQQGAGKIKLSVTATNVKNATGEVAFTLYEEDKFMSPGGKLLRARVPAVAPVTRACFWVKPGIYAAALYHDENADHDFNRSLFKIKEGFAFSNDAPTTLGLPSSSAAKFTVPARDSAIKVTMRYSR